MSGMVKVSICIPQFNRCDQLRLVIQDMLNQTYPEFESLIVDDASADLTFDGIVEFSDHPIRYVHHEQNLVLFPNFNRYLEPTNTDGCVNK